jgi:hypothetical protein
MSWGGSDGEVRNRGREMMTEGSNRAMTDVAEKKAEGTETKREEASMVTL